MNISAPPEDILVYILRVLSDEAISGPLRWQYLCTASSVNHRWRDVSLATPLLWAHISSLGENPTRLCLECSASTPLVVEYYEWPFEDSSYRGLMLALSQLYRIKLLMIGGPVSVIRTALEHVNRRRTPILEMLNLKFHDELEDEVPDEWTDLLELSSENHPSLHSLELVDVPPGFVLTGGESCAIRSVHMHMFQISPILSQADSRLEMLKSYGCLQELILHHIFWTGSRRPPGYRSDKLLLPSLRYLDIKSRSPKSIFLFLDCIETPVLDALSVNESDGTGELPGSEAKHRRELIALVLGKFTHYKQVSPEARRVSVRERHKWIIEITLLRCDLFGTEWQDRECRHFYLRIGLVPFDYSWVYEVFAAFKPCQVGLMKGVNPQISLQRMLRSCPSIHTLAFDQIGAPSRRGNTYLGPYLSVLPALNNMESDFEELHIRTLILSAAHLDFFGVPEHIRDFADRLRPDQLYVIRSSGVSSVHLDMFRSVVDQVYCDNFVE
jgi:hypothetical protein